MQPKGDTYAQGVKCYMASNSGFVSILTLGWEMLTCGPGLAAGHGPQGSAHGSGHRWMAAVLASAVGVVPGSTAVFQWLETEKAQRLWGQLLPQTPHPP